MEKSLAVTFKRILEKAPRNQYDEYWQRVNTLVIVAEEKGLTPLQAVDEPGVLDEVTRRTLSRKNYIKRHKESVGVMANVQTMFEQTIIPLVESLGGFEKTDPKEIKQLRKELKKELMPQLRVVYRKVKKLLEEHSVSEVARIYGK